MAVAREGKVISAGTPGFYNPSFREREPMTHATLTPTVSSTVVVCLTLAFAPAARAALLTGGVLGDEQTSILYDALTGEIAVDAPASVDLTTIQLDSAAAIFTGDPAQNLGGLFDVDTDDRIFKLAAGGFGALSFGNVAQAGLSEPFILNDLTADGSLVGGGGLGAVDLIYVPEPATVTLVVLAGLAVIRRPR